jgi:hypothetical protein
MLNAMVASESSAHGRPLAAREKLMKRKNKKTRRTDELRAEYNLSELSGGDRGKYLKRYDSGTNLVLLSPDVAKYFPDAPSVNRALRTLIRTSKATRRRPG